MLWLTDLGFFQQPMQIFREQVSRWPVHNTCIIHVYFYIRVLWTKLFNNKNKRETKLDKDKFQTVADIRPICFFFFFFIGTGFGRLIILSLLQWPELWLSCACKNTHFLICLGWFQNNRLLIEGGDRRWTMRNKHENKTHTQSPRGAISSHTHYYS